MRMRWPFGIVRGVWVSLENRNTEKGNVGNTVHLPLSR